VRVRIRVRVRVKIRIKTRSKGKERIRVRVRDRVKRRLSHGVASCYEKLQPNLVVLLYYSFSKTPSRSLSNCN
jgi:hypothetical protein